MSSGKRISRILQNLFIKLDFILGSIYCTHSIIFMSTFSTKLANYQIRVTTLLKFRGNQHQFISIYLIKLH